MVNYFGMLLKESFGSEGITFPINLSDGRLEKYFVFQFACLLIMGKKPVRVRKNSFFPMITVVHKGLLFLFKPGKAKIRDNPSFPLSIPKFIKNISNRTYRFPLKAGHPSYLYAKQMTHCTQSWISGGDSIIGLKFIEKG